MRAYAKFTSSGFSSFTYYGSYAYLTSSTNYSSYNAYRLYYSTISNGISYTNVGYKENGLPVRCIKGDAELAFDRTPSSSSVASSSSVDSSSSIGSGDSVESSDSGETGSDD